MLILIQTRKSMTKDLKLTVIPNPAKNIISVNYSLRKEGPICIKLYNIAGALVKSFTNFVHTKDGVLIIDIKTLADGVYLLRFDSEDMQVIRKLVIEK